MTAGRLPRGDGAAFVDALLRHHPDPFASATRAELLRQGERVDELAAAGDAAGTVELMRLGALLGDRDGHSGVFPVDVHRSQLHGYPIVPYEFADGVFVTAAEIPELVGRELVAVAGVPIDELNDTVAPLVAHDNSWTVRARRPSFVVTAEVLHGLGVVGSVSRATFELRDRAAQTQVVPLEPRPAPKQRARMGSVERLPPRPRPAYLELRDLPAWVEPISDGRAVHAAYNATRDSTELAHELAALAAAPAVELVVLDLRHNGGGDNQTYGRLLDALERLSVEAGKGLAVLTSRVTFSAAMQLVVDLEQRTPALFVGEPTGGSPSHYGDAIDVSMPRSGLTAHVATIAWMATGPAHERLTRSPDVPAPLTSDAFFAGRDLVLERALASFGVGTP